MTAVEALREYANPDNWLISDWNIWQGGQDGYVLAQSVQEQTEPLAPFARLANWTVWFDKGIDTHIVWAIDRKPWDMAKEALKTLGAE